MPELADVEGFRRTLEGASGHRVRGVDVKDASVLRNVSPSGLEKALVGKRLRQPERHGKWLRARTDGPTLLFHFGMSGALTIESSREEPHRHDRLVLRLDRGEVRYRDQRKLQGVWLIGDEADERRMMRDLGPDATHVDRKQLQALLGTRRASIKAVLMDQSVVAGLGNLMTDEVLWRARLHPSRKASDLDDKEVASLYRALRQVLQKTVAAGLVPSEKGWLTEQRDKPEPRCPRCRGPLQTSRVGGRTSLCCSRCQLAPRA